MYPRFWSEHPPHGPKCGQGAVTSNGEGLRVANLVATAYPASFEWSDPQHIGFREQITTILALKDCADGVCAGLGSTNVVIDDPLP